MRLSIIIPVYNTEKYVDQCIRSCLTQNIPYNDYEIIVVNDGTEDNSMNIINNLALDRPNLHIVSQKNMGLSVARNTGLSVASGKYVWFVDSDDWIEYNCLEDALNLLEENELEGLIHSGIRYFDDQHVIFYESHYPKEPLSGIKYMASEMINCSAVKTIYKRDFLIRNNLLFFPGIYHEDLEFTPRAYFFMKRLGFTNHHYYYNRLTPGSITQKPNPQKAFDLITVARQLYGFIQSHEMGCAEKPFHDLICSALNQSLYQQFYMGDDDLKRLEHEINTSRFLIKSFFHSSQSKFLIEGMLFSLFPSRCVKIYSLLHR